MPSPLTEEFLAARGREGQSIGQVVRAPFDPGLDERLPSLATPTLLVWGDDDQVVPIEHSTALGGRDPQPHQQDVPRPRAPPLLGGPAVRRGTPGDFLAEVTLGLRALLDEDGAGRHRLHAALVDREVAPRSWAAPARRGGRAAPPAPPPATSRSSVRASTSIVIRSPFSTSESGPPTAASGDTSATVSPFRQSPESWPSVTKATSLARPAESIAKSTIDAGPAIPGPPLSPMPRTTSTLPGLDLASLDRRDRLAAVVVHDRRPAEVGRPVRARGRRACRSRSPARASRAGRRSRRCRRTAGRAAGSPRRRARRRPRGSPRPCGR